ncbi:uncharacterized protein LOC131931699 [Physella acuta]|uniref:uncharacterized protein LOC131931699 n=1 Tax=Physella acuta TaxID=109671 RepID=UPI0027DE3A91|nr:uncharacterized protein LOC131931699 [Physella acuta]
MMKCLIITGIASLIVLCESQSNNNQKHSPFNVLDNSVQTGQEKTAQRSVVEVIKVPSNIVTSKLSSTPTDAGNRDRSPFSRPELVLWHNNTRLKQDNSPETWLSSVEARQKQNANDIPDILHIDLEREKSTQSSVRKIKYKMDRRKQHQPSISVYQDNTQRDMHDAGPGLTPWTRYTTKPKVQGEISGSLSKATGQCGYQRYSPRTQICCQGQIIRRQGIKPSCCGTLTYDAVFNKCCTGVVTFRSPVEPDC